MTVLGVFIALSFALSYIDSILSSSFAFIPGMKIGLAGLVTVFAFHFMKKRYIVIMLVCRCLLTLLVFGSVTSFMFSVSGCMLSFLIMSIAFSRISIIKTSMLGGITHNIGQTVVAIIITQTYLVIWQLPYLLIVGCVSGLAMGIIAKLIVPRLKSSIKL